MSRIVERAIEHLYRHATGKVVLPPYGPPLIAAGLFTIVFVLVGLALAFEQWLGLFSFPPWPFNLIIGSLFFFAGLFLVNWSVFTFAKKGGTPVPVDPPSSVVTDGPYAYIRNPMISGIYLAIVGVGTLLGSWLVVFGVTPLVAVVMTAEIRLIEEPELVKRLGVEYVRYRDRTPLYFPRLFW